MDDETSFGATQYWSRLMNRFAIAAVNGTFSVHRSSYSMSTWELSASAMPMFIISPCVTGSKAMMHFTCGNCRDSWSVLQLRDCGSTLMMRSNPQLSKFSYTRERYWLPLRTSTTHVTGIVMVSGSSVPPSTVLFICLALKIEGIVFITNPTFIVIRFVQMLSRNCFERSPHRFYSFRKSVSHYAVK